MTHLTLDVDGAGSPQGHPRPALGDAVLPVVAGALAGPGRTLRVGDVRCTDAAAGAVVTHRRLWRCGQRRSVKLAVCLFQIDLQGVVWQGPSLMLGCRQFVRPYLASGELFASLLITAS